MIIDCTYELNVSYSLRCFFCVRYGVSYRDLEEIMEERGVKVDHATLNRWVIDYSPFIAAKAKKSKSTVATSW